MDGGAMPNPSFYGLCEDGFFGTYRIARNYTSTGVACGETPRADAQQPEAEAAAEAQAEARREAAATAPVATKKSDAFMSLAARFTHKPHSKYKSCYEDRASSVIDNPIVHIPNAEDEWNRVTSKHS
ncbi:hypothetical protein Tsubulata_016892, partial [Turnera subulata]